MNDVQATPLRCDEAKDVLNRRAQEKERTSFPKRRLLHSFHIALTGLCLNSSWNRQWTSFAEHHE
jgi:hypothetical protein